MCLKVLVGLEESQLELLMAGIPSDEHQIDKTKRSSPNLTLPFVQLRAQTPSGYV
jgi:hypothetical protein